MQTPAERLGKQLLIALEESGQRSNLAEAAHVLGHLLLIIANEHDGDRQLQEASAHWKQLAGTVPPSDESK